MNSLSLLLQTLGNKLGVALVAIEKSEAGSQLFEIRFVDWIPPSTFSLILSRSWKSTQIRFAPDPFAGEFVKYLCNQISDNAGKVERLIRSSQEEFSEIKLEVDGWPLSAFPQESSIASSLVFDVEVLTSQSSIQFGLLNRKEERLVEFGVTMLCSLLPLCKSGFRSPDEVLGFPEGAVSKVLVNKYERDPRNRSRAILVHGLSCLVCGFNFEAMYGALGEDYIVVHHLVPVSSIGENYEVNPLSDLATVCANCHAMLHRREPPLGIEDLRSELRANGYDG